MNDIERIGLIGKLKTQLKALEDLPTIPTASEVKEASLHVNGGTMRVVVNAITRPHIAAILAEEAARLEAIALGVDRKVGP